MAHKLPRQLQSNAGPAASNGDVRARKGAHHFYVFFRSAERPINSSLQYAFLAVSGHPGARLLHCKGYADAVHKCTKDSEELGLYRLIKQNRE